MPNLTLKTVYGGQLAPISQVISLLSEETDLQRVAEFSRAVEAAKKMDAENGLRRNYWAELAIWSQRRLGQLIEEGQLEGVIKSQPGPRCTHGAYISPDDIALNDTRRRAKQLASVDEGLLRRWIDDLKEAGEVTTSGILQAEKKHRAKLKHQELDEIAAREVHNPSGVFDVIVIDPPWAMEKIKRDVAPNQVAFDYPTMTQEELRHLDVPCADDCHVWLWTTQRFIVDAFELLEAWQLKYVCTFVWHKPGGFQPFGLPQYNCEFALYARRGTPAFADTKDFKTCFQAPRTRHSEKPEVFYDMVRRVTAGRRLDMFNRRDIEGFVGWGNESHDSLASEQELVG